MEGVGAGGAIFKSQEIAKVPASAAKGSVWKISGSKQGSRGGGRSPGARMLVPDFSDLGPPLTGRTAGQKGQRDQGGQGGGLKSLHCLRGASLIRGRNLQGGPSPRKSARGTAAPRAQRETEARQDEICSRQGQTFSMGTSTPREGPAA